MQINDTNITGNGKENTSQEQLFPQAVFLTGGVLIILTNGIAWLGLLRSKQMCRQIRIISMNLCIADILVGLGSIHSGVNSNMPYSCVLHAINILLVTTYICMNMVLVTLLALDRYLAIKMAFRYVSIVTTWRMHMLCAVLWIFSISLNFIHPHYYNFDCNGPKVPKDYRIILLFLVSSIIVAISYIGIWKNIRQILEREKRINHPEIKYSQHARRVIAKVTTILLSFVFCTCTPLICYHIYTNSTVLQNTLTKRNIWEVGVVFMAALNTVVNPLIYVGRFKECRTEILKIICLWNESYHKRIVHTQKTVVAPYLISTYNDRLSGCDNPQFSSSSKAKTSTTYV